MMLAVLITVALGTSVVAQEPVATPAAEPPRGLRLSTEGAGAGYTLFAPLRSTTVFLIDMRGEVVHRWETGQPTTSVDLLPGGRLLACSRFEENPVFFGGGLGGLIRELDWDGSVLWEFVLSNEHQCQHHDLEPLPNGDVLAIVWEHLTRDEAIALGRDPAASDERGLWPDAVLEIEPARLPGETGGRIVWEWHARDHWVQDLDPTKSNHGSIPDQPGRIDMNADFRDAPPLTEEQRKKQAELEEQMRALGYAGGEEKEAGDLKPKTATTPDCMHTNSVDYNPELDLVLLSSPRLHEVFVIDHGTTTDEARGSSGGRRGHGGELLWRWGNPQRYGAGSEAEHFLFGQHDAEWIPAGLPGAGHVTLFNNGHMRPGREYSSIEELVLPFDPARGFLRESGRPYGPAQPFWRYVPPESESFYSFFISGCQRLANGNTLICSGAQGRFFEVTADGRIVWEYWNPYGGEIEPSFGRAAPAGNPPPKVEPKAVFRATRIAPDDPRLAGRKLGS